MHSFLFACVLCVGSMSVTSFRLPPVEEYIYRESISVELLTLEHPPSYRQRRSDDCTPDHIGVRFTADNNEIKLSLQRNYDINVNAPLFVNINGTITQESLLNSENVAVYQDLESGSAILVQCIPSTRKFELFGTFYNGSEELMIEPELNDRHDVFPAAGLSDIQGRNAKSKKEKVSQDEDLKEKFTISHHVIYKGKSMRPKETDYILKGDLHPKHRDGAGHSARNKRATTAYQVELLMVADYSAYSFWLTKSSSSAAAKVLLRQFYAFVLNGIDLRYKSVTGSGFTITVLFAGLYIAETPSDALWTESRKFVTGSVYQVTATAALDDFRTWIQSTPNLPGHDHSMLFTAYDLEANGNKAVAGLAYTEAACTTYSQSIVEDNFDAQLMTIAAHELGHGLGAYHDGTSDGTGDLCLPTQAFIMSASVTLSNLGASGFQYNKNLWKFSSCSLSYFQRYINTLNSTNCLTTLSVGYNSTALSPYDQQNPGQIYSADTQCRYKQGNDSYLCRSIYGGNYTNVCTAFYCKISGSPSCSLSIAAERTTCGDRKWCVAGECVAATEAQSVNDTCPFGDQPGIVAKGLTCTQLVANTSFNCYNYAVSCCESCQNVYTGTIGCEYGDKAVGCIANNCELYDNTSLAYCCKTCYVQPTTITTAKTSTTTTAAHTTITITPTTTSTTTVRTTTTTAASTSSTLAPTTTQTAASITTTTSAFPKATDTTVAPTSSSTTAAPTVSAATAAASPSSTTAAPTSTSTTAIPTLVSTTAAPTSTKTTATPTPSSTTAAVPAASSTITAPILSSTTPAPTPSSTTAAPTSTTTTVVPTPSSTTAALSPSSTTAAPNPTTTAAPTPSSATAAPTSSSTTAAPTLSSTTAYPTPSSTTAAPFPSSTTNTLTPSLTTTAKTPSSTTSAPTSTSTTAAPNPSSTTAASTPTTTTASPTPSSTTAAPTPSSTTSALTPSSATSAQNPSSTTAVPTQTTSTAFPTPTTTTSAPNQSSTTAAPTPTTTTAAPKSTSTAAPPTTSSTATVPSLTTTTAAPAPSSTTAAPTPSSSTSTPTPSSSISAQTPSSTTSAPTPYLTTAAPSPSSSTAVPTQTTSTASQTPTTTTAAPTQSSTTAAPTPTTTTAAPNSTTTVPTQSSTTAAPTPSSTTAAPTSTTTTAAPILSSTTIAPTPATTTATPTPSLTTAAPAPSSTTAASTPSSTTAAPTPSSTTAAPTPSSTTAAPTPSSTTAELTPSSTTSAPTLYLTTAAPSPSSTTAVPAQTISTASPTPTTTTVAPTTTTAAPNSTTTTAAPTPSSTTKAPTPSSTTAAPTPSSTTVAQSPSSTTAAPTPSSTTASPSSTTTTAAPALNSTTAAPTPTTTTTAPTPSSTTAAPPPSSTTAAPTPTTTTVAPSPGPSTAVPTPNSTTAALTPSSTAAVPNPTATTAAPTPTVSNTITSLPTTSMTTTPTTNTITTTTTTTEQQGTKKTAVTVRLNYNISSADNLSDSSTYSRYVEIVGESLREYYTRKVGQDVQINIRDIRRGSLIVQYELVIINTPIAQVALAKANIDLAAGENITVGGQVSGVESMVVENKTVPIGNSSKDHLCTVYILISGGCPDNYKCVLFNSSPLCQPITTTMDIVPVTVAAAVAGFVIIVAVVALICSLQRQVTNRAKHVDEPSNDSRSKSEMTLPQPLDLIEGHPKHESSNGQYPNVFTHAHKWYPGYGHSNKSFDRWSGELNSHSYYMGLEH